MAKPTKKHFAILGILTLGPASGYDIKKIMEQSTDHFWKEGDSSIYPILNNLLKQKYVFCETHNHDSGKPKKMYTLTNNGRVALYQWLEEDTEILLHNRNELMLKVFFSWNVEPKIIINHIEQCQNVLTSQLNHYQKLAKQKPSKKIHTADLCQWLSLKAGIFHLEAYLEWCKYALKTFKKVQKKSKPTLSEVH